jgi:hypothetical protein
MYGDTMQGVHKHLVSKTQAQGLTYIAELLPLVDGSKGDWRRYVVLHFISSSLHIPSFFCLPCIKNKMLIITLPAGSSGVSQPKQEHLACFFAGSLMLGATTAHRLDTKTCLPCVYNLQSPITRSVFACTQALCGTGTLR